MIKRPANKSELAFEKASAPRRRPTRESKSKTVPSKG
jgi:hypothetical protein